MIGSHQSAKMESDVWLTPKYIIDDLGTFDLDPCASINRPWNTAKTHYTINDNGLIKNWFGRIWLNPPYGKYTKDWLNKMAMHNNGIALIFARTETEMFFNYVWGKASGLRFIKGRLHFCDENGHSALYNSGAPSVLISYGEQCSIKLRNSKIPGWYTSGF